MYPFVILIEYFMSLGNQLGQILNSTLISTIEPIVEFQKKQLQKSGKLLFRRTRRNIQHYLRT